MGKEILLYKDSEDNKGGSLYISYDIECNWYPISIRNKYQDMECIVETKEKLQEIINKMQEFIDNI